MFIDTNCIVDTMWILTCSLLKFVLAFVCDMFSIIVRIMWSLYVPMFVKDVG